jgi:hypothetical protein
VKRLGVVVLLALVAVPSAAAWTRLTPDTLPNISEPVPLRLASGTELVAYTDYNGTITVLQRPAHPGATTTVIHGWAQVGAPALALGPSATVYLYFPGTSPGFGQQGTLVMTSTDGGATWTTPLLTNDHNISDVHSAVVRPNGMPIFEQDGTDFMNVWQGLLGTTSHNVFPFCCPYFATLGVDSTGLASAAFYSNATGKTGFLYQPLDATGAAAGAPINLSGGKQVAPRGTDRVPLVTDSAGNTFVAWMPGYPTPASLEVSTLRAGKLVRSVKVGSVRGTGFPLMALATDPQGRLWAAWTRNGRLWAARSRTQGRNFGRAVSSALPGKRTAYHLTAAAGAGLDAYLNLASTGNSGLWTQHLLPGLTVVAHRTATKVTDDGFPVAGATVRGGGKKAKTNAKGVAKLKLKKHTRVVASKSGYTAASATVH